MWFQNCCSVFSCLVFLFKCVSHSLRRVNTFLPLSFFFNCSNLLFLTWLILAFWNGQVLMLVHFVYLSDSSTNLCPLTPLGQTPERGPRGTARWADPRPERGHPTHHTPDRGPGAPQLLRCQGRLPQQPGPVWVVTLGWTAHQRRRWVFWVKTCLFSVSVGSLPLKSVTFKVIWLLVLSPGFLPLLSGP